MRVFGLTGGIGMGKSTCADLLRKRGFSVIDTDDLARELVDPGKPALTEIVNTFGSSVLDAFQTLRRDVLAEIVFRDSAARAKLESILHPKIIAAWEDQLALWHAHGIPTAVVVIPLLFETQSESRFDVTVCLACSRGTQHARLRSRGWSNDEIVRRSAAQLSVEEKMARADHVIWTEGGIGAHAEQAWPVFGVR